MSITTLHLQNFRNFSEIPVLLKGGCHLFVGPNAQGKTNVLEAIYLLAYGKSFRVGNYRDLIRWGEESACVKGMVATEMGQEIRESHLTIEKKTFLKNGKSARANQFSSMPLVLFAPEEILLLRASPSERRNYIDNLFTKLSPIYGDNLSRYKRALHHRNKLLKNNELRSSSREEQVRFWEAPLLEHGDILVSERSRILEELNPILNLQYSRIASSETKRAGWNYRPNLEKFEDRRCDELIRGFTLVGPHRDEILPVLNEEPISHAGSQGEMRTFTLALKLAEIRLFEKILDKTPILLLDDVMSELDENRSRTFFEALQFFDGDIFATATTPELFPKRALEKGCLWSVENGTLRPF